ncbi:molecular chaperone DnaJ [Pseudomonas sp. TE3610]
MSCWVQLGIEPTKDQNTIRLAYRTRLPQFHPETDPQGFQALRSAYESALAFAREPDTETPPPQAEAPADSHPLLADFEALLADPRQRLQPPAWQAFIERLDQLPLQDLDEVSWQLLWRLREAGPLANGCARLLASRLGWNQQLLRLEPDTAREIEAFLSPFEQPDPFDTTLMLDWSMAAQMETLWYQRTLAYLFQQRPQFEFKLFANLHTVVAFPADDALLERLLVQCTQADVNTPSLHALCEERHARQPDDIDSLYLLARQASGLQQDDQALACWARLWREHRHPQAPRALLELCKRNQPQHLGVLIQALDCLQPFHDWPEDLGDERQHFGSPAERPETLARWWEAERLALGEMAGAFVTWRLSGDELPLLALLLDPVTDNALQHLYRHAWALHRGDTALLQQVMQADAGEDLLDTLILEGLKAQADQHLTWLRQAPICRAMEEFVSTDAIEPALPGALTETREVCRQWLRRLRAYDIRGLARLDSTFTFNDMMPVPFALQTQAQLAAEGLVLPDSMAADDPWQWHRQGLFLLALADQPARWLAYVTPAMLAALQCEAGHPLAQVQARLLQAFELHGNLDGVIGWPDRGDPLHRVIATHLPAANLDLDGDRLPTSDTLLAIYKQQKAAFQNDPLGLLLYLATLYHDPVLSVEQREELLVEINRIQCAEPWFAAFHRSLVIGQPLRVAAKGLRAVGTEPALFALITRHLKKLNQFGLPGVPSLAVLKELQRAKDTPSTSPALRLATTALLTRCERLMRAAASQPARPAWAFWHLNSRLGRGDFIAQLFLWPVLGVVLMTLTGMPGTPLAILATAGVFSAYLRRFHDMGHGVPMMIAYTCLYLMFPFALLMLVGMPGAPLPNRYGPPPLNSDTDGLKSGLQATLRRLMPQRSKASNPWLNS